VAFGVTCTARPAGALSRAPRARSRRLRIVHSSPPSPVPLRQPLAERLLGFPACRGPTRSVEVPSWSRASAPAKKPSDHGKAPDHGKAAPQIRPQSIQPHPSPLQYDTPSRAMPASHTCIVVVDSLLTFVALVSALVGVIGIQNRSHDLAERISFGMVKTTVDLSGGGAFYSSGVEEAGDCSPPALSAWVLVLLRVCPAGSVMEPVTATATTLRAASTVATVAG
jgi:hypothetical protein